MRSRKHRLYIGNRNKFDLNILITHLLDFKKASTGGWEKVKVFLFCLRCLLLYITWSPSLWSLTGLITYICSFILTKPLKTPPNVTRPLVIMNENRNACACHERMIPDPRTDSHTDWRILHVLNVTVIITSVLIQINTHTAEHLYSICIVKCQTFL